MNLSCLVYAGLFWIQTSSLLAVNLVSADAIKRQKSLVKEFTLKNQIPVLYYEIQGSDILQINASFSYGLRDADRKLKPAVSLAFSTMPLGAKGYPKEKIFEITAKYSSTVQCEGGIELSMCSLTTVNDYWKELLPMFGSITTEPSFEQEDLQLERDRHLAEVMAEQQEPGSFVNEVVNKSFYTSNHPYRLSVDESIKALPKVDVQSLKAVHSKALNAKIMRLVVVGSLPLEELKAELEKTFGHIKGTPTKRVPIQDPKFSESRSFNFESRNIPTAYIRLKFNLPGTKAKDAQAVRLMMSILDEKLGEEVRTKRSLSYAIFANVVDYDIGIGVITASTSKPKETLDAIGEVIYRLKNQSFTAADLDEYKTVYATHYYLTLEEHAALAHAFSSSLNYFNNLDHFFDLPARLQEVSAKDVRDAANSYLGNFRMGVIYNKDKFEELWANRFISENRRTLKKSDRHSR